MKKQTDAIISCTVEAVLMPNGEVICAGKTMGWFRDFGKYITPLNRIDGTPFTEAEKKLM